MENNIEYKICLVCFDEFTEENPSCINPIECECKFYIHEKCWMAWINFKRTIIECPICHKSIEDEEDEEQEDNQNQVINEIRNIDVGVIVVQQPRIIRLIIFISKILVVAFLIFFYISVNF
jgi:E3 ubiquitin-protein ligase DOA10